MSDEHHKESVGATAAEAYLGILARLTHATSENALARNVCSFLPRTCPGGAGAILYRRRPEGDGLHAAAASTSHDLDWVQQEQGRPEALLHAQATSSKLAQVYADLEVDLAVKTLADRFVGHGYLGVALTSFRDPRGGAGLLFLGAHERNAFGPGTPERLQVVASHIELALRRLHKRAAAPARKPRKPLDAPPPSAEEVRTTASRIGVETARQVGADIWAVFALDGSRRELFGLASSQGGAEEIRLPLTETSSTLIRAFVSGHAIASVEARGAEIQALCGGRAKSVVAIPSSDGQGLVVLIEKRFHRRFTAEEVASARGCADVLFPQLTQALRGFNEGQMARLLELVLDGSTLTQRLESPEELIEELVELIVQRTSAREGIGWRLDAKRRIIETVRVGKAHELRERWSTSLLGWRIDATEIGPTLGEHSASTLLNATSLHKDLGEEWLGGLDRLLVLPLRGDGRRLEAIALLDYHHLEAPDLRERRVLEAVADRAGVRLSELSDRERIARQLDSATRDLFSGELPDDGARPVG